MSRVTNAASSRAIADSIVIDNPRARSAHEAFEYLIQHAQARPTQSKQGVLVVAPSQTGKSTLIQSFANRLNEPELLADRQVPVLFVTLAANVTRKGLAVNILEALEDCGYATCSHRGNETILQRRAEVYLREARVKLLVLDEFHHLIHSESQQLANSVGETIKRMLITGVCPIVLSGIEIAQRPFWANAQLTQRCLPPITLKPLEITNSSDVMMFMRFLKDYARQLEERGAATDVAHLAHEEFAAPILEVSQGILGAACNLIKDALYVACMRGYDSIAREDLAAATDRSFIATKLYDRNPFLHGLRQFRPVQR